MKPSLLVLIGLLLVLAGIAGWRLAVPARSDDGAALAGSHQKPARIPSPRIPAPKVAPPAQASSVAVQPPSPPAGPLARFIEKAGQLVISAAHLQSYLAQNRRNAESLLAAFRLTNDLALLREAAARFPDDPAVQLQLALQSSDAPERRQAIDALRESSPGNALGDYLSALEHFRDGHTETAFNDMIAAAGKGRLDDYSLQAMQADEEAYLAAGFTPVEAKAAAMSTLKRQQIEPLRELSKHLNALQQAYYQAGDPASADSLRQMGVALGAQVQQGAAYLIDEIVGISIERKHLNPATDAGRIAELQQRTDNIRRISDTMPVLLGMDENTVVAYFDRVKVYGEAEACRWLQARSGTQ